MNKKNKTYYGLPSEVKFCSKCVMSNQRPSSVIEFKNNQEGSKPTIDFDKNGVCSACNYNNQKNKIDWSKREKQLEELCKSYRSKKGNYYPRKYCKQKCFSYFNFVILLFK